MNQVPNGRWWRTPSFSVEDLLKWIFLIGPLALFWVTIWLDVRDIKKSIPAIQESLQEVPTKKDLARGMAQITASGDAIHEQLGERIDRLERRKEHQPIPKVAQYDWEK